MNDILNKIASSVEFGKINLKSPYPPALRGLPGADEYTLEALSHGISPTVILEQGLITGMNAIGLKFSQNKVFVPEMLMAAKAMSTAMAHLKPYFTSGEVKYKGVFVIGTAFGDLHDIGKNLVAMTIEGAGWNIIDLGVDVKPEKFLAAIEQHPGCAVGISALLTTTMQNMAIIVKEVKVKFPETKILVGGAPLTQEFCQQIGADFYGNNSQAAVEFLKKIEIEKNE